MSPQLRPYTSPRVVCCPPANCCPPMPPSPQLRVFDCTAKEVCSQPCCFTLAADCPLRPPVCIDRIEASDRMIRLHNIRCKPDRCNPCRLQFSADACVPAVVTLRDSCGCCANQCVTLTFCLRAALRIPSGGFPYQIAACLDKLDLSKPLPQPYEDVCSPRICFTAIACISLYTLVLPCPPKVDCSEICGRLPLFPDGEAPCPVQPCGCDDSCACAPQPGFCHNCGRPIGDCCGPEPPSFCPFCGRRLF